MPLVERTRIEVYVPDPPDPAYRNVLQFLTQEFTHTFGGCTILTGNAGYSLSASGANVADHINVVYSDAPLRLSSDRAQIDHYLLSILAFIRDHLTEETILITVSEVFHITV